MCISTGDTDQNPFILQIQICSTQQRIRGKQDGPGVSTTFGAGGVGWQPQPRIVSASVSFSRVHWLPKHCGRRGLARTVCGPTPCPPSGTYRTLCLRAAVVGGLVGNLTPKNVSLLRYTECLL